MSSLRLAAAILLAAGGWCAGTARRQKQINRCRMLEEVIELLGRLEQEIGYRHADLGRLLGALRAENAGKPMEKYLQSISTLQQIKAPDLLESEQKACFFECMSGLGRATAEQECARLAYYRSRFESFLQQAQKQAESAGLDQKLGLAVGGMLALLVL